MRGWRVRSTRGWATTGRAGLLLLLVAGSSSSSGASVGAPVEQSAPADLAFPAATGVSTLPLTAQLAVSATLGADDPLFHVVRTGESLRAQVHTQGVRAEFTPWGIEVTVGGSRWRAGLQGYGRGDTWHPIEPATPRPVRNRVEYLRASLTEWYVNGPLGLEQGFTLQSPPSEPNGAPLTLELDLAGDLTPSVEPGARALTLTRKGGRDVLRYSGLVAFDADGRVLPAWLDLPAKDRLRVHVDDSGARYPVVVDPLIETKLTASDGAANDTFGSSVGVSGRTVVIGAPTHDISDVAADQGAAYVFSKTGPSWTQTAKLTASDGRAGHFFGRAVAIDGNTIVVGAPGATSGPAAVGAVYVFVDSGGGWTQTAKLTASDGAALDRFGGAVALSGDTLVAAASADDFSRGSAYVFENPGGGWTQSAKLRATDTLPADFFGFAVAIDGDTVVVGAQLNDSPVLNLGSAYVFVEPPGGWSSAPLPFLTQTAKLAPSDYLTSSGFGQAVAIQSGGAFGSDIVVVGAVGSDAAAVNQGAAYVFVEPGADWAGAASPYQTETARLVASDGQAVDGFGVAVGISHDTVVVGAYLDEPPGFGSAFNSGSVYVFAPAAGWLTATGDVTESDIVRASDGAVGDTFGTRVAIDARTIVVGALFDDAPAVNQGSAYVFEMPTGVVVNDTCELGAGQEGGDIETLSASFDATSDRIVVVIERCGLREPGEYYDVRVNFDYAFPFVPDNVPDRDNNGEDDRCESTEEASASFVVFRAHPRTGGGPRIDTHGPRGSIIEESGSTLTFSVPRAGLSSRLDPDCLIHTEPTCTYAQPASLDIGDTVWIWATSGQTNLSEPPGPGRQPTDDYVPDRLSDGLSDDCGEADEASEALQLTLTAP